MLRVISRSLMESHGIWEGNIENPVVGGNDLFQHRTELCDFTGPHVRKAREVSAAAKEHFKRPDGPEGNHGYKALILTHQSCLLPLFDLHVVTKQTTTSFLKIVPLRDHLTRRCLRNGTGSPDLAMWMRVAGAHHLATVLEDLHVP